MNPSNAELGSRHVRAYFVEVVMPSYQRFIKYYVGTEFGLGEDLRNANDTAAALLHLGDRIYREIGNFSAEFVNPTEYRRSLFRKCKAYAIVSDVGLVSKHGSIDRGEGYVRSSSAITENIAIDRYKDKYGVYFRYRKLLEITFCENQGADLGRLLLDSMKFLSQELKRLAVIPALPLIDKPLPLFVTRASKGRQPKFRYLGLVGEYVEWGHKIFFYRNDSRLLSPMRPGDEIGGRPEVKYEAKVSPSPFDQPV